MDYKERFKSPSVKTQRFEKETLLTDFVQMNYNDINIIQIYTSVSKDPAWETSFIPKNNFHIMYKLKERIEI